jgi:adenosyl cobinamide kinase/adenosyl cobinamide phosphate guanylyltransferase
MNIILVFSGGIKTIKSWFQDSSLNFSIAHINEDHCVLLDCITILVQRLFFLILQEQVKPYDFEHKPRCEW